MNEENEDLSELSPANSHPNAARILADQFYWDCVDDNSPFGNDTGADTLESLREWREEHPQSNPVRFLKQLLKEWEVTDDYWDVTDPVDVQRLLDADEFSFSTRDEAVIALAFGQLILEGKVEPEIKRRALSALERQSQPAIINRWGEHASERGERLQKMKAALEQLEGEHASNNSFNRS
jgi:uncharacterized protein YfeS